MEVEPYDRTPWIIIAKIWRGDPINPSLEMSLLIGFLLMLALGGSVASFFVPAVI